MVRPMRTGIASVLLALATAVGGTFLVGLTTSPARADYPPGQDGPRAGVPYVTAARTVVGSTTTLSWVTFIPQAKIDAPLVGCSYGRGYQFGGDNHSAYDWTSSRYRTALHAVVAWKAKTVSGGASISASHVYRKSTGKLVATRTASSKDMSVRLLGFGSDYVDIRMVTHASNPFCSGLLGFKGAIDGAISIRLYKDGYWQIRSGNHRRMPNHYIYIYNSGRVTDVYKARYDSAGCLIGQATCPLENLTGFTGTFR